MRTKSTRSTKQYEDDIQDIVLIAFHCDHCNKSYVAKVSSSNWRETLRCKCGAAVIVHDLRPARGKCKKCQTAFYNMFVLNKLERIRCRRCSSDIDLFVGRDGKYTA